MIKWVLEQVIRRPKTSVSIIVILTALFGCFIPRVRFSTSVEKFFMSHDPDRIFFEEVQKVFGQDEITVIAMVSPQGEDIFDHDRILKLRRVSEAVEEIPGVQKVLSLANVKRIFGSGMSINVKPLIPGIPETEDDWAALKSAISENPMYERNIISPDRRTTAINVFLEDFGDDASQQYRIVDQITAVLNHESGPENLYVSGIAATQTEMDRSMILDL